MWSWGAGGLSQGWVSEGAGLRPDFTLSGYWSLGSHDPLRALLGCSHSRVQEAQIPLRDWSELTQVVNSGGGVTSGLPCTTGSHNGLPSPSFPPSQPPPSPLPTPRGLPWFRSSTVVRQFAELVHPVITGIRGADNHWSHLGPGWRGAEEWLAGVEAPGLQPSFSCSVSASESK